MKNRTRLLLIDGSNYLARGHFSCKDLKTKDGTYTGAIKGFLSILIADMHVLRPDLVVVAFDEKGKKNWRQIAYPAYKQSAARVKQNEKNIAEGNQMVHQYEPMKQILKAAGIQVAAIAGEEADDIIGTLARRYEDSSEVIIASVDKDFAQMVSKRIKMMNKDRELCGTRGVRAKFGVRPDQIVDYLTLCGDSVDNIPGVYKVGAVTASKLLSEHGDLRSVVLAADSYTPALCANMKKHSKDFKWTKPLLTIKTDVEGLDHFDGEFRAPKYNRLKRLCTELELISTHKQLLNALKRIHGDS